jgi:hypothetical protein
LHHLAHVQVLSAIGVAVPTSQIAPAKEFDPKALNFSCVLAIQTMLNGLQTQWIFHDKLPFFLVCENILENLFVNNINTIYGYMSSIEKPPDCKSGGFKFE